MSNLPRQLQRQAEEIEAYDKAMADAAKAADQPPNADNPPETPTEPVGTPKVETPATPPPPAPEEDQWRQRYLTLEGKYRAEVPRLHAELKDLRNQLQVAVDSIKSSAKSATPEATRSSKVTAKDVETFGGDLVDLIKRQAEDVASAEIQSLKSELASLRAENNELKGSISGVTKSQEVNAQEIYLGKLAQMVPDWATINVDQRFLDWLAGIDELSGLTRQQYLENAYQSLDVQRTATIFNAWKATVKPAAPPQQKSEVQRQVEPGKSRSAPVSQPDDRNRQYTLKEIEEFYVDVRTGKISRADAERIEAEIDLAVAQGRVK